MLLIPEGSIAIQTNQMKGGYYACDESCVNALNGLLDSEDFDIIFASKIKELMSDKDINHWLKANGIYQEIAGVTKNLTTKNIFTSQIEVISKEINDFVEGNPKYSRFIIVTGKMLPCYPGKQVVGRLDKRVNDFYEILNFV